MMNKDKLHAKLTQNYQELLTDVEFHIEDLKFDFAEEVSNYLGKGEGKITRAELARRMGTSAAWITKMLRTNWNMTMETMAKIAFALDMKVKPMFVPIRTIASRAEWYDEQRWKDTPQDYTVQEPEDIPEEKPFETGVFQPLEGEPDFESMPSLEEAFAA